MEKNYSVSLLTKLSMLIALSAVAAYIPIPSPIGTVALDSAAGYFAVLAYGLPGIIVLALGHVFSALKMGFPLGSIHLFIAIFMGVSGVIYFYISRKYNLFIASLVGIIFNGIVMPFSLVPFLGKGFFLSMIAPLLLGSAVNIILSSILYKILNERINL